MLNSSLLELAVQGNEYIGLFLDSEFDDAPASPKAAALKPALSCFLTCSYNCTVRDVRLVTII